jgi:hypothetical protein
MSKVMMMLALTTLTTMVAGQTPTPSPTYDVSTIAEARANLTEVLANQATSYALISDATAAKAELEAVFAAYKNGVRQHMKDLLEDKQWSEYDAADVLTKFQEDKALYTEAKLKIRSLRRGAPAK